MSLPAAGPGVFLVDTGYVRKELDAAYLVVGRSGAAFVDTGVGSSVPRLLYALEEARLRPDELSHVIVTHVHLDHAGGAGGLLKALPQAKLVVHPRGARHLIDPSKLVASAKTVYGEEGFRDTFGEIVPVDPSRVVVAPDGFLLDVGGRTLSFQDAPGHARHHFVVVDEASRGVFTGDSFGLAYREAAGERPFLFPTTTPVQFDPPELHKTIDRILSSQPERLYLTHYGPLSGDLAAAGAALHRGIEGHVEVARQARTSADRPAALRDGLYALLLRMLAEQGSPLKPDAARAVFGGDIELNAQGLGVWLDSTFGPQQSVKTK